jgi:hypothetical protein
MATVTISVPDEVLKAAKDHVGRSGYGTVEECLVNFVHSLTQDGEPIDEETEAALLEGLESPLEEMTDKDWQAKLRQYDERQRQASPGGDKR